MDDVFNRLAKELAEAISSAVRNDPAVESCREKVRAAGFEMRVTLTADVGFVDRSGAPRVKVPRQLTAGVPDAVTAPKGITAEDKRFLRSLRIAADEPKKEEVE